MKNLNDKKVIIIGGGPAGLTAAYQLSKQDIPAIVLEKENKVGGISKTVKYKGFLFDLGGHRFFTKVKSVQKIWDEVLSDDFLLRPRLSRIYFNKKFFSYPMKLSKEIFGIGLLNTFLIPISYCKSKVFPYKEEANFEQWVSNRFGKKLYEIFFKTYTEKVWGMKCNEISSDWAAQRIKGLSLTSLFNSLFRKKENGKVIKTLIEKFHYPRKGPGMMWEKMADMIMQQGNKVEINSNIEKIIWNKKEGVEAVEIYTEDSYKTVKGSDFISSMPIRELIKKLSPSPPPKVIEAAKKLRYRDFIIVSLILKKSEVFPDNWIYIHDPTVKLGRIQNFKNWSPEMVEKEELTCLGLEYFCFENDGLWNLSDEDLIKLGKKELGKIGLAKEIEITDGKVVRVPKAYPIYDDEYKEAVKTISDFINQLKNLQLVGRNGMHKYNNQDHSMLTSMLAVENILGANHDLWKINADEDYQEEEFVSDDIKKLSSQLSSTQPMVPERSHAQGLT